MRITRTVALRCNHVSERRRRLWLGRRSPWLGLWSDARCDTIGSHAADRSLEPILLLGIRPAPAVAAVEHCRRRIGFATRQTGRPNFQLDKTVLYLENLRI